MKKITGFKQKEAQIDESLDRTSEINTFFNNFSLETRSASSSPPHSQTDPPPSMYPQFFCHTLTFLSSTSAMTLSASTCLSATKSDAGGPLGSPSFLSVFRSQLKRQLNRLIQNKAASPNDVSP
ncbi:hypothetical protein AMECASPLE_037836 [Ameca splendens]|uniref:Uncharacterized protein n=1 Tax=Ameca splendens TaxID=208324 RepID=A0ABV0ZH54_9TELE